MAGTRPIGSAPDKQDRNRPAAPRRREASLSDDVVLSENSCPHSAEAVPDEEPEEQEPSPRSSPTAKTREPFGAPASPTPLTKKRTKKHTDINKAGHRHSRGNGHGCSRSGANRHRRRDTGAAASDGNRDPPRGAATPRLPRPPLLPPPQAMRRVTLQAHTGRRDADEDAEAAQVPPPPPPAGPTPEEHLQIALAFMRSLDELERDAAAVRGTLEHIKQLVRVHIMNLRNQFRLVL